MTVTEKAGVFAACDPLAEAAVAHLQREVAARGGNLVTKVQFWHRRTWQDKPACRRNLVWAVLIIPMFFDVPQAVRVRGEAIYDPVRVQSEIPANAPPAAPQLSEDVIPSG